MALFISALCLYLITYQLLFLFISPSSILTVSSQFPSYSSPSLPPTNPILLFPPSTLSSLPFPPCLKHSDHSPSPPPPSLFCQPLQESLKVQEFFLRVDEEEAWMREREPAAASTDYGKDHSAVVALQQKHQALEAEIEGGCGGCGRGPWNAGVAFL